MKNKTVAALVALPLFLLIGFGLDYLFLPAWNLQSFAFWMILAVAVTLVLSLGALFFKPGRALALAWSAGGLVVVVAVVVSVGSWLVWPGNDQLLATQLAITEQDGAQFSKDFPGASLTAGSGASILLPSIDKDLSYKIAQGKLGPYGAQFQMDFEIFTSVNIVRAGKQVMVRISPLDYSGAMVAFSSGDKGSPGYIEVDQGTGEGRLVPVEGGMKYTPGGLFGYDLARHLRFAYRTALFGNWSFEVDNEGKPYWVVPVLENRVGLFGGSQTVATVLVDPVTGATELFAQGEEPAWIDRVIPSELVIEQANNALSLKNGWVNQVLGEKREVFQLSDGYNYISTVGGEERTWLVSGITSPNEADQTVIGFMMVDLRTQEARRYSLAGITEMRAMEIAQNDERVRAQSLTPTWPIVMEVQGTPAYFLMLKNSVQRQRFAIVDVANGTLVALGETLADCQTQFASLLGATSENLDDVLAIDGWVLRVRDNYDGTSSFLLQGDPANRYIVNTGLANGVLFLATGDQVVVYYRTQAAVENQRLVLQLRNLSIGE